MRRSSSLYFHTSRCLSLGGTNLKTLLRLCVLGLTVIGPSRAVAMRGELCFPLEGWALVSHWHLGSGARSIREGWMLRQYDDRAWGKLAAGREIPASEDGVWLRNAFNYSSARWTNAYLEMDELPTSARFFINGRELTELEAEASPSLNAYLRTGTNSVALVLPPGGRGIRRVPSIRIRRIRAGSGRADPAVVLKLWRYRSDRINRLISDAWIKSSDTSVWRLQVARPPLGGEMWVPAAPVLLKAALDFPRYWAGRELSAYFHEIPGDPDVYVNGRKCIDRLNSPARLDLAPLLKFDGRDSLCLVYPGLPYAARREDGEWGMVAIHWSSGPHPPRFASGTTVVYEAAGDVREAGIRHALNYASQVLTVSASPYELNWDVREPDACALPADLKAIAPAGPKSALPPTGALLAGWPHAPFSRDLLDPLLERIAGRRDALLKSGLKRVWIISPPAVGARSESVPNSRLSVFRNRINSLARAEDARVIPLFDVFRSALRRQRRWPAAPSFSDDEGRLTPHGSFLAGLAILDAFSLP